MHSLRRIAILISVQMMVMAPAARGQSISGIVVDTLSGRPVGQGFVALVDSLGRDVARTLTDRDGRFRLDAPGDGAYRLQSERIGYRKWLSEIVDVTGGSVSGLVLRIAALPNRLADLEVVGETTCDDPDGEIDTALLWEEARKALAAAAWTSNQGSYEHLLHAYRRRWNRGRTSIESEELWNEFRTSRLPFVALDADSLADSGFVIQRGAVWDWYAPDANVLLDDRFHETHCFSAVRGDGDFEGMVGLQFTPTPGRRVPDIKGTLWIAEHSSELRRIEYQYTRSPDNLRDERIGGSIVFRPLATGAWIIESWVIRRGIPDTRSSIVRRPSERRSAARIGGFFDRGGQVIQTYDLRGNVVYESSEMAVIHGTVYDSIRGAPLADEAVWIVGTGYSVLTGDDGKFAMHAILNGDYQFVSERLDSLGYMSGRAELSIQPGDTVHVDLTVPNQARLNRDICPENGIPSDTRAIVGRVRNFHGDSVANVWVEASWFAGSGGSQRQLRRVRTDGAGRYRICNVPVGRLLELGVLVEELDEPVAEMRFTDYQVQVRRESEHNTYRLPELIFTFDIEIPFTPGSG